jgi:hypothetical protein
MTLLEEIQGLLERTYASTGLKLDSFLIGRERCADLSSQAGPYTREMSDAGRTFLRTLDGNLLLAIYYSTHVVEQLEREHPKNALNERNIRPLIVFIEEIAHALHAALRFLEGHRDIAREEFSRDLELQGKVDTYLVLQWLIGTLRASRRIEPTDREWLRHHVFEAERFDYSDANLAERYRETNILGQAYSLYLDELDPRQRVTEIRHFRPLHYGEKRQRIESLAA